MNMNKNKPANPTAKNASNPSNPSNSQVIHS